MNSDDETNPDTDIRNYSYDEILDVLQIKDEDLNKEKLREKTDETIKKLKGSNALNEKQKNEYTHFFNSCFHEVCRFKNFTYNYSDNVLYRGALPQRKPVIEAMNTTHTKYSRGDVNPIYRETIKNTLIVNNKMGTGNASTDFTVDLSQQLNNVVSLKVAGIELANFFYNISTYLNNNTFRVISYLRNDTTGEISDKNMKTVVLDDGYYNISQFTGLVEPLLDSDPITSMVCFVYDIIKGKLFFSLKDDPPDPPPTGFSYEFELDFYSLSRNRQQSVGWYMGYKKLYYSWQDYNLIKTPSKEIGYNTEMGADFTGTKYFLLEVTDFNNNSPQVMISDFFNKSSDILAKIPNSLPLTNILYENSSDRIFKTRKYFGPVKIQKLKIRLLDEFGKLADINSCDLCVTLEFESLDVPHKNFVN